MKLSPMPLVRMGSDALSSLEALLDDRGWHRLLILTGPHISRTDQFQIVRDLAASRGREVRVFDQTTPDPTIELAREASHEARNTRPEAVVAIGGGSVLDTAKIVAAALTSPGDVRDFLGTDRVPRPAAPLIAIPATSGTGSEVTNISILTDTKARLKMAAVSDHLLPQVALLVPELTFSMPPDVTAATGLDAFCHAAEAFTSLRNNPYSDALALQALRLIRTHLLHAHRHPRDRTAREGMQLASLLAGLAFNNSSVTAIHAFSYPLGGVFHVPHGLANSLMAESVFRHNAAAAPNRFADLAEAWTGTRTVHTFLQSLRQLRTDLGLPLTLRAAGIPEAALRDMADNVLTVTRLLSVNPAPITPADALRIFQEAYGP